MSKGLLNALLRAVVVNEKNVVDLAPSHVPAWGAVCHRGDERLAVPRVEGTVVSGFAARREDEVVGDFIAAAKAVIGVDAGARAVEHHIPCDNALGCL